MTQLVELQKLLGERVEAQMLAVSTDSHEDTRELLKRLAADRGSGTAGIGFPLLEDQGHRVIDRYGIRNPQTRGWPHPATYVIDRTGMVRWRFVETDYRVRPTNDLILSALKSLD